MSTVRTYLARSFRLVLGIWGALLGLVITLAVVLFLLPDNTTSGVLILIAHYLPYIFAAGGLVIGCYLAYCAYGVLGTVERPAHELRKMMPAVLLWVAILGATVNWFKDITDNTDCEHYNYNEQLHGGSVTIGGTNYVVNLCGTGKNDSHFGGESFDTVRIEVLSAQGELLAKRYYSVYWLGQPGHEPLEISENGIRYLSDASSSPDTITMPPSAWDWLRARIPLFN